EHGGGEQIVCPSGGDLRDEIGGRRGDDDEFGLLPDPDMVDGVDLVEDVGGHRLPGQGFEGGAADEFQRVGRGHDLDAVVELPESPDDVCRFVGGDPTGDAEYDSHWSLKSIAPSLLTGAVASA